MENTVLSKKKSALQPMGLAVFNIDGIVDASFKERFKNFLRSVPNGTHVILQIDSSNDGDIEAAKRIIRFIRLYQKYKGCRFIMHIHRASSAALLIALIGDERMVTAKSRGKIARISSRHMTSEAYEALQEWQYRYLKSTVWMSHKIVDHITNRTLSADSMLRFGIATKRISF